MPDNYYQRIIRKNLIILAITLVILISYTIIVALLMNASELTLLIWFSLALIITACLIRIRLAAVAMRKSKLTPQQDSQTYQVVGHTTNDQVKIANIDAPANTSNNYPERENRIVMKTVWLLIGVAIAVSLILLIIATIADPRYGVIFVVLAYMAIPALAIVAIPIVIIRATRTK